MKNKAKGPNFFFRALIILTALILGYLMFTRVSRDYALIALVASPLYFGTLLYVAIRWLKKASDIHNQNQ
jgi:hypothetical protein